jgi:hypothetical protein
MFKIFYAEKDATLYQSAPTVNTGIDEILEIGKRLDTDGDLYLKSRTVIKFDMAEVSQSLADYGKSVNDCKFILNLYTSHAKNLPADYTIVTKLLGEDWINGTGYASNLTTNGVSWSYPGSSSINNNSWISVSQSVQIGNSTLYVTGSGEGGSWLYQSSSIGSTDGLINSESFSYRTTDINLDVTDSIKIWLSGSDGSVIPNYGMLLQFSDENEADNAVTGYVRYFSRETHTIYVPRLTMYWDNSTFTTGSLLPANLESYIVYTDVKPMYKDTSVARIRIYTRDKYPQKSPTNLFPNQTVNFLPEPTSYAVFDAATDEAIIPFDDIYNKVSCDTISNFIYLDFNGFMPERYYRLEFKIKDEFTTQYVDDQIYFKVIR